MNTELTNELVVQYTHNSSWWCEYEYNDDESIFKGWEVAIFNLILCGGTLYHGGHEGLDLPSNWTWA